MVLKNVILTLSVILPNLVFASIEKNPIILTIDSASESEVLTVKKILSDSLSAVKIEKSKSNNLIIQIDESQLKIDELISNLRDNLGNSVRIEQLKISEMKIATQDFKLTI